MELHLCSPQHFMTSCINKQRQKFRFTLCNKYLLITPWISDLFEKLRVPQRVLKFPIFYGTQIFISHLQQPATCTYPQPVHATSFSLISNLILSYNISLGILSGIFRFSCTNLHAYIFALISATYSERVIKAI